MASLLLCQTLRLLLLKNHVSHKKVRLNWISPHRNAYINLFCNFLTDRYLVCTKIIIFALQVKVMFTNRNEPLYHNTTY